MSGHHNNPLSGIWRFVGLRSAGRRSFALEPVLKPRKRSAECLQEARSCAANDSEMAARDACGAGCCRH